MFCYILVYRLSSFHLHFLVMYVLLSVSYADVQLMNELPQQDIFFQENTVSMSCILACSAVLLISCSLHHFTLPFFPIRVFILVFDFYSVVCCLVVYVLWWFGFDTFGAISMLVKCVCAAVLCRFVLSVLCCSFCMWFFCVVILQPPRSSLIPSLSLLRFIQWHTQAGSGISYFAVFLPPSLRGPH